MHLIYLAGEPSPVVFLRIVAASLLGVWFGALVSNGSSLYPAAFFHGVLNLSGYLNLSSNGTEGTTFAWLLISLLMLPIAIFGIFLLVAGSKRVSLPAFLILTPLLSLAIPFFLPLPMEITPLVMVFVPALMAIILAALTEGKRGVGALFNKLFQWRIGFKWYALTIGLAFGVRLAISLLALLLGWIPAIQLNNWSPAEFIVIGVFIVIGAITEELGWRGYALPKLLANRSALTSALFGGVIWGCIHLGLILPGQMNAGTPWLPTILYLTGLSVILTWLYIHTRGSLAMPILYHTGQSYFVFLNGGISITQQIWLLTGVTLGLALILMLLFGPDLQRSRVKATTLVNAG
jgi:membrane protease YdiL (CAAX protease family)